MPFSNPDPWLPHMLRRENAGWRLDWCALPAAALAAAPFFDPAVQRCRAERPSAVRTTALETLDAFAGQPAPQGFVFHVSRCGSTLLARLLMAAGCRVLSEPGIVEQLLQAPFEPTIRRERLRALFAAFAAPATGCTVLKFSARSIVAHATLRSACPDVPCVVVYRAPAEVLVALVGRSVSVPPGVRESGLLGADAPDDPLAPVAFWARVLARQFAAALDLARNANALLLNHDELPAAAWHRVAPWFGCAPDEAHVAAMEAAAQRDAKTGRPFADDRAAKRAAVTTEIAAAVAHRLQPDYDALETLRRAQLAAGC